MKKNKKIFKTLLVSILVVVAVILSLSNIIGASGFIGGVDAKITDITKCNTTAKLAWFIANYPEKFMAASNDDIWRLKGLWVDELNGTSDVFYYSCACMYHTQQTEKDGTVRPENIILLETPGKITIYDNESHKETPVVIDLTNYAKAEEVYKKIYGTNATFSEEKHNEMKFNISMFTYAVQQIPTDEFGGYGSWAPEGGSGLNSAEDIIKYYWWKKDVQKYIMTSGILDKSFSHHFEDTLDAPKTHAKYAEIVEKIIYTPSLEIINASKNPTIEYKNGKAYIGPLKANYSGGTPSIQVGGVEVNWVTKQNGEYSKEEISSEYVSGQEFFAVLDENAAKSLEAITVEIKLNYESYKSKLALFKNGTQTGQCLMYHNGEKTENNVKDTWTVENGNKIEIQKQDTNGNNLNIAGIRFEVYDAEKQPVGTLTTDGTGKTNSILIAKGREYTIKEIQNTAYGYKGCTLTEATIVSGSGLVSVYNGQAKINVTEDTIIGIKNEPELGQISINKKGDSDNEPLANVEFVLWQGSKFVQLKDVNGNVVPSVSGEVTINANNTATETEYKIEYISQEEIDKATRFKTDNSGNIIINNVEIYLNPTTKYEYWLYETVNNNPGYKGMTISDKNVTVTGGTILTIDSDLRGIKFVIDETVAKIQLNILNSLELGFLELEKVSEAGTSLSDVEFIIEREENEYLQVKDDKGNVISTVRGNELNNIIHEIIYVSEKENTTRFITDEHGRVIINNLEINKSIVEKYSYTAHEVYNPNYGYGSKANSELAETITGLKLNETSKIKLSNTQELGNLQLKKYDESNKNIVLADVGFVIELTPSMEKNYGYLALYNQNGELVPTVKGIVTINAQNEVKEIATGIEYKASYYYTEKEYLELTDEEKANITTFLTGDSGILTVNNLEVYSPKTLDKYTYRLIETSNANYGFVVESKEIGKINLKSDETAYVELANEQKYTEISGYVWIEETSGKANDYDKVYSEQEVKLTDLYILQEEGQLVVNPQAKIPVEIKLRNKVTGEIIKTQPDEFDANGKYTLKDIEVAELANYEVTFIYNGFEYTTITSNLNVDNGSKVEEVSAERTELNKLFGTVKDKAEVVSTNGNVNKVQYNKNGHISEVSNLEFNTKLSATTSEAEFNLREKFNTSKNQAAKPIRQIENVNMGLILREQPKVRVGSDIYHVYVEVNGRKYTYEYNTRSKHFENVNNDEVGVKFEQEKNTSRYTQNVYSSDVKALENGTTSMNVSIVYKINISNKASTLTSVIKEIANYYDKEYTIEAIGATLGEVNKEQNATASNFTVISTQENISTSEAGEVYNCATIKLDEGIKIAAKESKDVYIKFNVSKEAILGLLTGKSTYHNATELMKYSTCYGERTGRAYNESTGAWEYYTSDESTIGNVYAGIDIESQPGNIELILVDHPEGGTKVLDTSNFENDTSSAPALILEATESRIISGTIWEDAATNTADNQKLGNGKYDVGEKFIKNVEVRLYKVDENGNIMDLAKYSNGEDVIAITDGKGNYTFGKYELDENGNIKECIGVLPGRYVIKYTYNNESCIVDTEGNVIKKLNVNDYKSTIITSEVIKNAFNGQNERWYIVEEKDSDGNIIRYSDGKDNISLRPEYNPNIDENATITNSTYNNTFVVESMDAYTPIMDIGIEFTLDNLAEMLTFNRVEKLENVDFGIVERPNVDITIDKKITALEIVAQNGTTVIPKGDPSNSEEKMQYVKTGLDGIVPVELETKLLQGATLNLEYTISVSNNSQKDYLEEEYYYYGTGGTTELTTRAKLVVDYLESSMTLQLEDEQNIWRQIELSELYDETKGIALIDEEVYNELKSGNYHILATNEFEDVGIGDSKEVKLYTTKYLAVSNNIVEDNHVEILELIGKRTIKDSTPGNHIPVGSENINDDWELDEDKVRLTITPPTGTTVNYVLYIIATAVTLTILVFGITIIKKKIVK